MPNIKAALQWYSDRLDKVYYSMAYRNGQLINANGTPVTSGGRPGFDCSSAGYYALKAAGFFGSNVLVGNTDSMYNDLERNGWTKLQPNAQGNFDTQAGDAALWGKRGASGGAFGHFMMFLDANNVIHCNSYYNSIHINNYDGLWEANGEPEATFYRYTGASYTPPSIQGSPTDQLLDVGSWIKFAETYSVDDLKQFDSSWQVKTDKLCPSDFSWADNGVPTEPLVEVDANGYATTDQDLAVGSRYILPGKFEVRDLGETNGVWLALITANGLSWWVDVATATEIAAGDAGTPTPSAKPKPPASSPPVVTTPSSPADVTPPENPDTGTETPQAPSQPVNTQPSTPTNGNKPKEDSMAFTQADQKKLNVQTEKMQTLAGGVAASDEVEQLISGVSNKAKLVVYIVGDALIGLGLLTPNVAVVAGWHDLQAIVALSSALGSAGAFLLTMFGIFKNGQK